MKKIILLIAIVITTLGTLAFTGISNQTSLKRVETIKLNKTQLKVLKQKNLKYYQIKGGYATPAEGYAFYYGEISKKVQAIYVLGPKVDFPKKINADLTTFLSIISEGKVMVYCSCGLNVNRDVGDSCQHYATSSGIACGGACSGDFDGQTCSVTSLNTETGEIKEVIN